MKTSVTRIITAAVASLAITCAASAISLSPASLSYVGLINDGVPSNPADETGYINILTTLVKNTGPFSGGAYGTETYDRLGSTLDGPFATAVVAGAVKDDSTATSIDATGFAYVLGKYDQSQAGSLVWYVAGGFGGVVTLPDTFNGHALSHISLYNRSGQVPEGGSTVLLLGLGFAILALVRRQIA